MSNEEQIEFSLVNETYEPRLIRVYAKKSALWIAEEFKKLKINGNIHFDRRLGQYHITADCLDSEFEYVRQKFNTRSM